MSASPLLGRGRGEAPNNKDMNNTETRTMYEAPKVEVIEVEVERGFAVSGTGSDSDDSEFGGASERRGAWGDFWE